MDEAERRVGAMEDSMRDHSATLHSVQVRLKHLESSAEDAENWNWRNNLRIIGLLEEVEGANTPAYTECLLRTLFPQAAFSPGAGPQNATHPRAPGGAPPHLYLSVVKFQGPRFDP